MFDDETYYEPYGEYFTGGNHVYPGSLEYVIKLAENVPADKYKVYPKPEEA